MRIPALLTASILAFMSSVAAISAILMLNFSLMS